MLCIIAAFTTTLAQADCPASVLLALARAAAACMGTERNQFCHGNGESVSVHQYGSIEEMPVQPGDRFGLSSILELGIGDDDPLEWNVASLQVQANLPDTEQRSATFLLFGNVYIANEVPPLPELTITSTGTLNIRALPEADAGILTTLPLRGTATANGRTQDNRWLRVVTRNNVLGWASVENLTVDGSISSLDAVDASAPFVRPFQIFTLYTGMDDAPCDGASESGLLIQTPGANVPVELTVNGVLAEVAGTASLQAQPQAMMTVNVLDGYAEIGALGAIHYIPAGARIHIPLGEDVLVSSAPGQTEPYDLADLQFLPINNLPYRFAIPQPLTQEQIDAAIATWNTPDATPVPTPGPREDNRCRRVTRRSASLSAGPGTFYEVVNEIRAGASVDPVFQVRDAAGAIWWQLRGGNWIPANVVESTGNCADVPVTTFIPAPTYNELSLETCETTNGPLREGQYVEITFVPPAWRTYEDAYIAPQVDPGQITVDSQSLYVYPSRVIQIAEERFIRVFEAYWEATAGTHRIVGERLHYIITCTLTVPVG